MYVGPVPGRVSDKLQVINSVSGTRILLPGVGTFGQPSPAPKRPKDSHENGPTFGVVYANDLARAALSRGTTFPAGSIIVREKLPAPDAVRPELLAVMYKRARGFNPKGGDWEFLILDGAATRIQERQKNGSCLDCHDSQRDRDFVFPPTWPR